MNNFLATGNVSEGLILFPENVMLHHFRLKKSSLEETILVGTTSLEFFISMIHFNKTRKCKTYTLIKNRTIL